MSTTKIQHQHAWNTRIISILVACGASGLAARAEVPRFLLEDLGTLGGSGSQALAMNDYGDVVGWATAANGETHGFLHRQDQMIDLGTLGGTWSEARAINNKGHVVGVAETPEGDVHAFIWHAGQIWDLSTRIGAPVPLYEAKYPYGAAPEACNSLPDLFLEANAINDRGWIAGCATIPGDPGVHAFALKPRDNFDPAFPRFDAVPLGIIPRTQVCIPNAMNNHDVIVGLSGPMSFKWEADQMDLLDVTEARAMAINEQGVVVGSVGPGTNPGACVWRSGTRRDLVDADRNGEALDVNDHGVIVGWADVDYAEDLLRVQRAAMWTAEGVPLILEERTVMPIGLADPLVALRQATAIDKAGRIVGYGYTADGDMRAFRLTPLSRPCRVSD